MIHLDRRLLKNFDWITFLVIILLTLVGIMTIYSATRPAIGMGEQPDFYSKQLIWLGVSIVALFIMTSFDYIWLFRLSYPLYSVGIILLLIVLVMGKTSMGAQRWINLGFFSFQPSEFFRIFFIIAFSSYLSILGKESEGRIPIKGLLIFGLIPLVLLIKQPDLGTAILLLALFSVLGRFQGHKQKDHSCCNNNRAYRNTICRAYRLGRHERLPEKPPHSVHGPGSGSCRHRLSYQSV